MRRMHDLLPAEIPDVQMCLVLAVGQRHIPAGDLDAFGLLLLVKRVVNQRFTSDVLPTAPRPTRINLASSRGRLGRK
jgi:hypothetical protein